MRHSSILLGLLGLCCTSNAEEFLVRLKAPKTLGKLMDSKMGEGQLKSFFEGRILKTFSFGKFEAFTIEFPIEWVGQLRRNPFIADIVPNIKFNIFDDNTDIEIQKSERPTETQDNWEATFINATTGIGQFDHDDNESEDYNDDDDDDDNGTDDEEDYDNQDEVDDDDDETDEEEDEDEDEEEDEDENSDDDDEDDIAKQRDAPRHLARISRRGRLPLSEDGWPEKLNYYYDNNYLGYSVNAYIIDTGIFKQNKQFQGRAKFGADMVGEGPGDLNGHGTHVAGLVGSKTFGVAKEVQLIEVKALNSKGQGNLTSVLSSIEFFSQRLQKSRRSCVANLSLGSFRNSVLNQAVEAALESGLVIVAAAGNSNANACWSSPASSAAAITVGAFDDRTDTIARFSNWGSCVDIFAPGVRVESLSISPPFKPVAYSGTSMASPIVTGIVATLLDSGVEPRAIKTTLIEMATTGVFMRRTLFLKPGTSNRVLFSGVDKDDDVFEDSSFPTIDLESLLKDLESYNEDSHVSKDDAILPLGEIKLRKRSIATLKP